MEKMEFPWLRDITPTQETPILETPPPPLTQVQRARRLLQPYTSHIAVGTLILALALFGRCTQASNKPVTNSRNRQPPQALMMSLVAIPKGHRVPPEALTEVQVRADTLSKGQRLRALTPEHLPNLRHTIVAKKDIPPQTPIFWSDLKLADEIQSTRSKTKVRVHFDATGANP